MESPSLTSPNLPLPNIIILQNICNSYEFDT